MKTYALSTAIKMTEGGRDLCFRPVSCVGTGNGVFWTIRGRYVVPDLPSHLPTIQGRWVIQTIASVEKEQREHG